MGLKGGRKKLTRQIYDKLVNKKNKFTIIFKKK